LNARSVSDNGEYPNFCYIASNQASVFADFRSDSRYKRILEHLTPQQGFEILKHLEREGTPLLEPDLLDLISKNDFVGGPDVLIPVGEYQLSPGTLRYLNTANELRSHFRLDEISTIAEIGVGYGGQVRVLDALKIGLEYTLFDLQEVLGLASRYLNCFVMNGSYEVKTINQVSVKNVDLIISMYALSELPRFLQMAYYEKLLKHAKNGYMIINDCWHFDRLSRDEWRVLLNAKVLEELPSTAVDNYVLIWGT
jgi:hypothetical protein